jgi:glycosyltransferase involved in cell wall biosynthesis
MRRLAFLINFNQNKWLGGLNIILNLINSICLNHKYKNIKVLLVTNNKRAIKNFKFLNKIKIIEDKNIFNLSPYKKIIDKINLILFGKTIYLERFLIRNKIDIISHSSVVSGKNSYTKSIVWIPDFQFYHFPNYFSWKYKFFKKLNIKIYINQASKILLSSFSAKKDLIKINKSAIAKTVVNSFSFTVPEKKELTRANILKNKYDLPNKFFYLPNQYWIHKNHIIVIKALIELVLKFPDIKVISTGSNHDYRSPDYFTNLMSVIKKNNLQNNYIYLGVIPYKDSMSLIKNSLAIINPSKFEGWSSTVEQAKSFGKLIILSNISVHKEQNPNKAFFFNPDNHKQLSETMSRVWNKEKNIKNYYNKRYNVKFFFLDYSNKFLKIINSL